MSYAAPQFAERIPIDATRSWTAEFESFNERTLDLYYIVTVHDGVRPAATFIAEVFPWWSVEKWDDPAFVGRLRDALHEVAVTGRSNTAYRGYRPGTG